MTDPIDKVLSLLSGVQQLKANTSWKAKCPAHNDDTPSLTVSRGQIQPVVFHCFAGCNSFEILEKLGLTYADIMAGSSIKSRTNQNLLEAARIARENAPPPALPKPAIPADRTPEMVHEYTDAEGRVIYRKLKFRDDKGKKYFTFERFEDGKWIGGKGCMENVAHRLYKAHRLKESQLVFIVEGEKKVEMLEALGLVATTNDDGAGKWKDEYSDDLADKDVVIIDDNDEPGHRHGAIVWDGMKHKAACLRRIECLPGLAEGEGLDNWIVDHGHNLDDLCGEVEKIAPWPPQLSVLSLIEILTYQCRQDDNLLGDRILAAGEMLGFVGPGGIGKSRAMLNVAIACILGWPWGNLATRAQGKRWLFFQTENSIRRLQNELDAIMGALTPDQQETVIQSLHILCPIKFEDRDVSVGNSESIRKMAMQVKRIQPDICVFDPLNDFFSGDNMNDEMQMKYTLGRMRMISQAISPDTAIVVVHHAGYGKASISEAFGYSRGAYGTGSKAFGRTVRAQINLVPGNATEQPPLIVACGKNNNGKEFKRFAMKLDEASMLYKPDAEFDFELFDEEIKEGRGRRGRQTKVPVSLVKLVLQQLGGTSTFTELTKKIADAASCGRSAAVSGLKAAEKAGGVTHLAGVYSIKN